MNHLNNIQPRDSNYNLKHLSFILPKLFHIIKLLIYSGGILPYDYVILRKTT